MPASEHAKPPITLLFVGAASGPNGPGGGQAFASDLIRAGARRRGIPLSSISSVTHEGHSTIQRIRLSLARVLSFIRLCHQASQPVALIFVGGPLSFMERASMAYLGYRNSVPTVLCPRSGHLAVYADQHRVARRLIRFALKFPSLVICQSEFWADYYRRLALASDLDIVVVPNGLDTGMYQFHRRATRAEPFTFLFMGSLAQAKGLAELFGAFKDVRRSLPCRLIICGSGPLEAWCRIQASPTLLGQDLEFRGWCAGQAKRDALEQADCLVLPSHAEGFPNVVLEAMASGLPVIGTAVGAVPEIIGSERTGLIVPAKDVRALADAMRRLALDREWADLLGSRGAAAVLNFSVSKTTDLMLDLAIHLGERQYGNRGMS